jgi:rubrerythrin
MSNIHEDFEDGDVELKDGYLEYQGMLELRESGEWAVSCPDCGDFVQIQKTDPAVCPKCQNPNIETEPN